MHTKKSEIYPGQLSSLSPRTTAAVAAAFCQKNLGEFSGSTDDRLQEVEACLLGAATKEEVALKADANRMEVG